MKERCADHREYYTTGTEQEELERDLIRLGKQYVSSEITTEQFTDGVEELRKKRDEKH